MSEQGALAEYHYIWQECGIRGKDWTLQGQALVENKGRYYDRIEIKLSDGSQRTFYFDITDFYGKPV